MEIEGKKVLILGLGITGISACKVLSKRACKLYLYDDKYQEQIEKYKDLKEICHERLRMIYLTSCPKTQTSISQYNL